MRRMRGLVGVIAVVLALGMVTSGCYGPFRLTKKLHTWNGQVGGKWANEGAFILLAWLPVYGVVALADAILFNSIEFWGGQNPIADSNTAPKTKRIVRRDAEAVLTRLAGPAGPELVIEQYQFGQAAGTLRIQQHDGMTVGLDGQGKTLFTATTLADGSVLVRDAAGKQVAMHSPEEMQRLGRSTR